MPCFQMLKNRREEKKRWGMTYRWTDLQKTSETNGSLLGEIKGHFEYHLSRKKKNRNHDNWVSKDIFFLLVEAACLFPDCPDFEIIMQKLYYLNYCLHY